jgi:hypothetical protein
VTPEPRQNQGAARLSMQESGDCGVPATLELSLARLLCSATRAV